jgi:septum site-determining protein MinC
MDKPCFELKGSLFTLTVLQLFENDLALLESQLKERVKMAPGFFNHTPVVIDLHSLPESKQDLDFFELRELLLSFSIIPVGVKGAKPSIHTLLEAAGLATLAEAKTPRLKPKPETKDEQSQAQSKQLKAEPETEQPKESSSSTETATKEESKAAPKLPATKIVKQTIRSGRQIYASGDLVIIGSVSPGAEILADGNIHIYGTLRGRALAGVRGDQSAAIFCHSIQAELISIAGIYLLSEDLPADKIGGSVHIFLENEKLQIDLIN